jgi:hypothetical protein
MMPQMGASEPQDAQFSASQQGYTGNSTYNRVPPTYEHPQTPPSQMSGAGTYDDDFIEAVAQRLGQRLASGGISDGKLRQPSSSRVKASPGMRLALAIVSICMLAMFAGILLGGVGGALGLVGFMVVCGTVIVINIIFNL